MGQALRSTRPDLDFYLEGFETVPLPASLAGRLVAVDLRKPRTR
jgi:hypothetical protein